MTSNLKKHYDEKVAAALTEAFSLENTHEIPALEKVVINCHVGRYQSDRKAAVEDAVADIEKITGQKPSVVFAKKSVANFKVREGEAVGARVTLRKEMMWEFLDRFINITSPNVRDFRGFSPKGFDGRGNFALGVPDQSIFPEIEIDKIKRQLGFDLIIVTSTNDNAKAKKLLELLHFPFRENKKETEATEVAAA